MVHGGGLSRIPHLEAFFLCWSECDGCGGGREEEWLGWSRLVRVLKWRAAARRGVSGWGCVGEVRLVGVPIPSL